jgi:Raf kinase inhibitor-like YbhB/YbcL family protein
MMLRALAPAFGLVLALAACGGGGSSGTGGSTTTSVTGGSGTTSSSTTSVTGGTGGASTGGASTGGASTGGASTGGASTGGSGGMAAFALTSTGFVEGAEIPSQYACSGANVSPPLAWTPGPQGTQSYAIVFTDKSNNLIHWVLWDIPSSVSQLPENVQKTANPSVPAGAKQVKSYDNSTFGYLGPCPPNKHTYEFAVHALDVASLPNVTTSSTRAAVNAEIGSHDLGSATLTGTFTP